MPVPGWLRAEVADPQAVAGKGFDDVAFIAGAAVGALDALVRRDETWAGVWRLRLALTAAAASARQAGRAEDEPALRDALFLTRPGDMAGPAGLLLVAWRRLATCPAAELLTEANLAAVLEEFGYVRDDGAAADLADDLRLLGSSAGMVDALAGAIAASERYGFARAFGYWLADALLAQRLGWSHAVPLLGTEAFPGVRSTRQNRPAIGTSTPDTGTKTDGAKSLLAAQARVALRAVDLSAELGRRAERLLSVAPRLRAKGSGAIVAQLLNEDALAASRGERRAGMSDRGLRRLFERLVELGGVRELSGRPTFRIYGL